MKQTYTKPQMIIHGNVEEITQAFGPRTRRDVIYIGGANIDSSQQGSGGTVNGIISSGSIDGVIEPLVRR